MSTAATLAVPAELKHPEIVGVTCSPELIELRLAVPDKLAYFRGHFPGFAILPGVVQLDWVIRYAKQYFALDAGFPATLRIKFKKPIRPNHRVTLRLQYTATGHRVQFDYRDADGACSSGQIDFTTA